MPPLRSTIAHAPTTWRRRARATSIVSRVEPPVVTTSSTTSTLSSGPSEKPRRSVSAPSWRSAKIARTPSARATSWPMTMPPSAGDRTRGGAKRAHLSASAAPIAVGVAGVLQHQRALEVAGAMQAGRQPEMALEQGAGAPEQR